MFNSRLINTKVAGGGGGCTDIVDNYDPFDGGGVALYQLNGDATDESPNAYNGTWSGTAAYTTGVFGQSANFTGSNSITINPLSGFSQYKFTMSFWMKTPSAATSYITSFRNPIYMAFGYGLLGAYYSFTIYDGATIYGVNVDAGALADNSWHNVTATHDGVNLKIYVDGNFYNSTTTNNTTQFSNGTENRIAARVGGAYPYTGQVDQLRIFNTALDPLEVEALYKEELCICDGTVDTLDILGDGSCIATYQLDGNANDLSGNYSGTPTDVSYGVGEFDLAGVFNGSTSRILNTVTATTITSFSMWVKINDTNTAQIIQTFGNNEYLISVYLGKLNVQYAATSTSGIGWTIANQSNWHHIAGTITSSSATLYVDGQQKTDTFADYFNGQSVGCIGDRSSGDAKFNGSIDQVRIFNKALDQNEVDTLYAETACTYGGRQSEGTQILGDTSCIAYYKLDGTAADETGTYNGTFTTPNYENGEFLYSAVFNGSTSAINTTYTPTVANLRTVSLWFKAGEQSSYNNLFSVGPYGLSNNYWWAYAFLLADGRVSGGYGANNGGSVYVKGTNGTYDDNLWHHLVITFNGVYGTGSSIDMYVDNVLITTTPSTTNNTSISAVTGTFRLGHVVQLGGNYQILDGSIDQVRVFDRELTSGEVTTLYNEGI